MAVVENLIGRLVDLGTGEDDAEGLLFPGRNGGAAEGEGGVVLADGNAGGDDGVDLSAEELDVLAGFGV